jgi:putative addiction module killer protein
MVSIHRTEPFDRWLRNLRDTKARAKVLVRLERLARGNPGDVAPIGEGLSELRIDYGPGYRVYYAKRGDEITVLCGGDKDSQAADIREAKTIARELET